MLKCFLKPPVAFRHHIIDKILYGGIIIMVQQARTSVDTFVFIQKTFQP